MRSRATLRLFCALLVTAGLAHCKSGEDATGAQSGSLCLTELPLQNPRAFPLGETFYLPAAAEGEGCPGAVEWELVAAPAGSQNVVYSAGAPHPRFTPDVAGTYELRRKGGNETVTLTAVAETPSARFRNHHLTPLFGMAPVGGELWVAGGASYTIARIGSQGDALVKTGEVAVGSWPAAVAWRDPLPYALVAQRGSDTVGFVNIARGVLEDALWVGDEPTGLALSPDAQTLYVSLATERAVAVVDLPSRTVRGRVAVGFDPRAMALSADGTRLFVASYRSANLTYGPGGSRAPEDDQDIFVVDTAKLAVERTVNTVAADLRALALSPDGRELYVAATDGETIPSQADPNAKPFTHLVAVVGAAPGEGFAALGRTADLTRQSGAKGPFVGPAGVLPLGDALWVSAESSNEVAILDRASLAERARLAACDGPRALVPYAGGVAVHCFRSFEVQLFSEAGETRAKVRTAEDPRPPAVALGESLFYKPGNRFAANHSCSSCHIETQNDGMIWRFGQNNWANVRPLQLLHATTPVGWHAYVSSVDNFGFQGPGSIIGRPASTEEAQGLTAFLGSLLGAPRATGKTRLDGSFTAQALRGKELFEGKAACSGCHSGLLYTNRRLIEQGKSGEEADVPTLLGAYRHGVYFVKGQARTLPAAVDVAASYVGVELSDGEKADLVRFLEELTSKGSAPLAMSPDIDSAVAVPTTAVPRVAFADAVDDTLPGEPAAALAEKHVVLTTKAGAPVAGQAVAEGNTLRFVPAAPLTAGETYRFAVTPGLRFRTGGVLEAERSVEFAVARPAAALPERMTLTVYVAAPRPGGGAPQTVPVPFPARVERSAEESYLVLTLGQGQEQRLWLRPDGEDLYLAPFALPLPGIGAVADAGNVKGKRSADPARVAEGTLTVSSPSAALPGVRWELTAAP